MPATSLWEILVPQFWNPNDHGIAVAIDDEHHHAWDEHVRSLANGLTILKPVKGQWVSPQGALIKEPMIPVRIVCDDPTMQTIILFTLKHYEQKTVMAYRLSSDVRLVDAPSEPTQSDLTFMNMVRKAVASPPMYSSYHIVKWGKNYAIAERHYPGVEVEWRDVVTSITREQADMLDAAGIVKYWMGRP